MMKGRFVSINYLKNVISLHRALRSSQELVQKCPYIPGSNWNLVMSVFEERGKPEYLEKNLSEQSREPTTNWTRICCKGWESNPGHHGGKQVLSPQHHRGLPRGLSDKWHCVKMWRQIVTKVPTTDRSWHERGDNLRKQQSIFHFNKATTALFFFDGDMTVMTWQILTRPVWLFQSSIVCLYGRSVVHILTKTNHHSTLFTNNSYGATVIG